MVDAANAALKHKVAVKCATITPNRQRVGGIPSQADVEKPQRHHPRHVRRHCFPRSHFDPVHPALHSPTWTKPITIARHAYGDVYKAVEYRVPGAGKAELVFTNSSGAET